MSGTTDAGDSYTTDDEGKTQGSPTYVLGVSCGLIFLILIISYVSCMCRRNTSSPSLVLEDEGDQLIRVSGGVDDDVLMTFPTFVYSEDTIYDHKGGTSTDASGSGCSICLVDYKRASVIRLLPKCGHLFHSKCIDTWLKIHASCPVCRNSPLPVQLPGMVPLSNQRS